MNGANLPVHIGEVFGQSDDVNSGDVVVHDDQNFNLGVHATVTYSYAISYGVYTAQGKAISFSSPFWQNSFRGEVNGRTLEVWYDQDETDDTDNSDWDTRFMFELQQGNVGIGPAPTVDPNAPSIVNTWPLRQIEGIDLPVQITAQDGSGTTIVITQGFIYVWDRQGWLLDLSESGYPTYSDYGLYKMTGNAITFSPSGGPTGKEPVFTGSLNGAALTIQYDMTKQGIAVPPLAFTFQP